MDLSIIFLLITFFVFPMGLFHLVFSHRGQFFDNTSNILLFFVTYGFSVILVGRIYFWGLFVSSELSAEVLSFVLLLIGATPIYLYKNQNSISALRSEVVRLFGEFKKAKVVFGLLILIFLSLVLQVWIFPIDGNDTLEYLRVSRAIWDSGNPSVYPILDPKVANGMLSPWSHPPGYISVITFFFDIRGTAFTALYKTINLTYIALFTLFIVVFVHKHFNRSITVALITGILFLSMPSYWLQGTISHIDSLRLFLLVGFTFIVVSVRSLRDLRSVVFIGVLLGLTLYGHALGAFGAMFFVSWVLLDKALDIKAKVFSVGVVAIVSFLFVARQLLVNFLGSGNLFADQGMVKLSARPEMLMSDHLSIYRGLDNLADKLFFGALRGFSDFNAFGFVYWFFAGGLVLVLVKNKLYKNVLRNNFTRASFIYLFLFFGIGTFLLMIGSVELFKNERYFLTVHPFLFPMVSVLVAWLYGDKIGEGNV